MTTSNPSPNNALSCLDNIAAGATDLWLLVGRVLIGWLFLYSGYTKIMNIAGAVAYLTNLKAPMPETLVYFSVAAEFGLGILLVLGLATRYAAVLGMVFMVVATALAHRYWEYPAAAVVPQFTNFIKNLAIFGAMFYVFVTGPGRFSVDGVLSKR